MGLSDLRQKMTFTNAAGLELAAVMEWPAAAPRAFALFSHCFTCGKDIITATRVGRALADLGIAVLRFDFTGLGDSEGEFAATTFSDNVADLQAAADFLRQHYQAPQLLIGHSFGGTAALTVASQITEVQAVVTIASPSSPEKIQRHFVDDLPQIQQQGEAVVDVAGRPFTLRKAFIDDLGVHDMPAAIGQFSGALLVCHSPVDETVPIIEATRIYQAASHPKSFISLDQANHLLTDKQDALYLARTIAAWVDRYLKMPAPEVRAAEVKAGEVLVRERDRVFLRDVVTDDHQFQADEPRRVGGSNLGPDPYELLLAALGTCTSMTVRMYANRKGWPLDDIDVRLSHRREHTADCADCEGTAQVDRLQRRVRLYGELSEGQRQRLLEIADKCPVHRTLEGRIEVESVLEED